MAHIQMCHAFLAGRFRAVFIWILQAQEGSIGLYREYVIMPVGII